MNLYDIEEFAQKAHEGQKRRFSDLPYVTHPKAVKSLLQAVGVVREDILAAALLHDVVEDTICELDDIREVAGDDVADLVEELTLENPNDEKQEWLESFSEKSNGAIIIKLCDRICNVLDFLDAASEFKVDPRKPLDYYLKSQPVATAFLDMQCSIENEFGGGTIRILADFYMHMVDVIEDYKQGLDSLSRGIKLGLEEFDDKLETDRRLLDMNEMPLWKVEKG